MLALQPLAGRLGRGPAPALHSGSQLPNHRRWHSTKLPGLRPRPAAVQEGLEALTPEIADPHEHRSPRHPAKCGDLLRGMLALCGKLHAQQPRLEPTVIFLPVSLLDLSAQVRPPEL